MKINIKKISLYILSIFFLIFNFTLSNQGNNKIPIHSFSVCAAEEESNELLFIKSSEDVKDFIYDGSIFLYGGILLISISVIGIFFTFKPKKQKNRRKKRNK